MSKNQNKVKKENKTNGEYPMSNSINKPTEYKPVMVCYEDENVVVFFNDEDDENYWTDDDVYTYIKNKLDEAGLNYTDMYHVENSKLQYYVYTALFQKKTLRRQLISQDFCDLINETSVEHLVSMRSTNQSLCKAEDYCKQLEDEDEFFNKDHPQYSQEELWQKLKNLFGNPQLFRKKSKDESFIIGEWFELKQADFNSQVFFESEKPDTTLNNLLIGFIVSRIKSADYGAGCHYELQESRRQETIRNTLSLLSETLTKKELNDFKSKVEYIENYDAVTDNCEQCGQDIGALEYAKSTQYTGKALCHYCYGQELAN